MCLQQQQQQRIDAFSATVQFCFTKLHCGYSHPLLWEKNRMKYSVTNNTNGSRIDVQLQQRLWSYKAQCLLNWVGCMRTHYYNRHDFIILRVELVLAQNWVTSSWWLVTVSSFKFNSKQDVDCRAFSSIRQRGVWLTGQSDWFRTV